jgi:hypothetical protein
MNPTERRLREACWEKFWQAARDDRLLKDWQDHQGVLADWLDEHGSEEEAFWLRQDWKLDGFEEAAGTFCGPPETSSSRMILKLRTAGARLPHRFQHDEYWSTNAEWLGGFRPRSLEIRGSRDVSFLIWDQELKAIERNRLSTQDWLVVLRASLPGSQEVWE